MQGSTAQGHSPGFCCCRPDLHFLFLSHLLPSREAVEESGVWGPAPAPPHSGSRKAGAMGSRAPAESALHTDTGASGSAPGGAREG